MKTDTHPTYFPKATVKCACGNTFNIGATQENIEVEICSACHPFFTGQEKIVDTAGRVDKFKKRQAAAVAGSAEEKKAKKKAKLEAKKKDSKK